MNPERIIIVNGSKIEEFYWHGKYVVYKNNVLSHRKFDEEVQLEQNRTGLTKTATD